MNEIVPDGHTLRAADASEIAETESPTDIELPYGLKAQEYWHFMDDWDISDQQKAAWLVELAHIIKGFVDWGVGQDTVQALLARNFVDKSTPDSIETPLDSGNVLEQRNMEHFNQSASDEAGKAGQNE